MLAASVFVSISEKQKCRKVSSWDKEKFFDFLLTGIYTVLLHCHSMWIACGHGRHVLIANEI